MNEQYDNQNEQDQALGGEIQNIMGNTLASQSVDSYMLNDDGGDERVPVEQNQTFQEQRIPTNTDRPSSGEDQGFIANNAGQAVREVGAALVGGTVDAVDSLGSFLDLSGDTVATGLRTILGKKDSKNNPFSKDYKKGAWWDVPDELVPENNSGMGKLARGLVEFGLLTAITGGIGGKVTGAARIGSRAALLARQAGAAKSGVRFIKFVPKATSVLAEGAAADLISESSEMGNIANLVNQYAPFIPFTEALAVDPETDSVWVSRMKTVAAGAGMNAVGHILAAVVKGKWAAVKSLEKNKNLPQAERVAKANVDANKEVKKSFDKDIVDDAVAHDEMTQLRKSANRGLNNRDFRTEYNKLILESEDFKEYELIKFNAINVSERPELMKRLREIIPDLDNQNLDEATLRDLALQEFDDLADVIGGRKGDPWLPEKGLSLSQAANIATNGPDEFVDALRYGSFKKATYRTFDDTSDAAITRNLQESISNVRIDGVPASASPLVTEAAFKKISRGDKDVLEYVKEVAEDLSGKIFSGNLGKISQKFSQQNIRDLIIRQTAELHEFMDDGPAAVDNLRRHLLGDENNRIIWAHDGEKLVTITATQKAAAQLFQHTLAKQLQAIATGAVDLPSGVSKTRQADMMYDMLKLIMLEQKKLAYLTGNELLQQRNFALDAYVKDTINKGIKQINQEMDDYFANLAKIRKGPNGEKLAADLEFLHLLSGGRVTTLNHIHTYLNGVVSGNPLVSNPFGLGNPFRRVKIDGQSITPRLSQELSSVYYSSMLSNLRTPFKANFSTVLIAALRPAQAWIGSVVRGDQKAKMVAVATMKSVADMYSESLKMWRHNWDLGVNRKTQSYVGKFTIERDIEQFNSLEYFYNNYSNPESRRAYQALRGLIDFNTNPFVRFSTNLMGAGDAFARTLIGRHSMRMKAATEGWDKGLRDKDLVKYAIDNEKRFRDEVFVKGRHDEYIVSDKAATLAGNEAAMTQALPPTIKAFETLSSLPGGRFFFPFVRTGYNALRLTFASTELERFTKRFDDIMNSRNLDLYGLTEETVGNAQALMRGRMAVGNAMAVVSGFLAINGLMTGDLPPDRTEREQWQAARIQPNSFKIGNSWVSYTSLEPFNTIFSTVANVATRQDALGEDVFDDMAQKITFMFASVLVDKSMLAGVDDLVTIMDGNSTGAQTERVIAKLARNSLPYAGFLGGMGDIIHGNRVEANTMFEQIFQRDALLRASLPAKYDILNKDRSGVKFSPNPTFPLLRMFNSISPFAVMTPNNDPVKQAMLDINFNIPDEVTQYAGEPLTSAERSELQRLMSMDVTFRKNLEAIVNSPSWKAQVEAYRETGLLNRDGNDHTAMPFYERIRQEFVNAKERAITQVLAGNEELDMRINKRKRQQQLLKRGDLEALQYLNSKEFHK